MTHHDNRIFNNVIRSGAIMGALLIASTSLAANDRFADVEIKVDKVNDNIYMLTGAGGNIGLSVGEDGAYLIDDQFAPLTDKIRAAVASVSDKEIEFVINTHWHGDHTGGNEQLAETGTVVVAHDNVHKRMSTEQQRGDRVMPAAPKGAQPVVTYSEQMSLKLNNDDMRVYHVANAHTDGDSIIYFRNANVIHMGDTFFNGRYPFVDTNSGGNVDGMIAAHDFVLSLASVNTKIIPGHGPLSTKAELQANRDMLATVRDRVAKHISDGKSLEDIKAAEVTKDFDETYNWNFISGERLVEAIYNSLK